MSRKPLIMAIMAGLCLLVPDAGAGLAAGSQRIDCSIPGYTLTVPASGTGDSGNDGIGQCINPNIWESTDGKILFTFRYDGKSNWTAANTDASVKKQAGNDKADLYLFKANGRTFSCGAYVSVYAGVADARGEWDTVAKGRHYQIIWAVYESGTRAQAQARLNATAAALSSLHVTGPQ